MNVRLTKCAFCGEVFRKGGIVEFIYGPVEFIYGPGEPRYTHQDCALAFQAVATLEHGWMYDRRLLCVS